MMAIDKKFNKVVLDEKTHVYTVEGNKFSSVSSRIEEVSPIFPKDIISKNVARKRGISQEEVLEEWAFKNKNAIDVGNGVHDFGEEFATNRNLVPKTTKDLGVVQWWEDLDKRYEVFSIEHPIYYELVELAGTPDILLLDKKTNELVIADYKSNAKMFDIKSSSKLADPFSKLPNSNFGKYTIQLNYYQYMLEKAGYKVSKRIIIWLNFSEETLKYYKEYEVDNIIDLIDLNETSMRNSMLRDFLFN